MTVFLSRGYQNSNIDEIAAAANVSRQTIYNHFGDKASLFRAICMSLTEQITAQLIPPESGEWSVRSTLERLGCTYLELMLRPTSLALHRMIISETARFQDLGPAVYEATAAQSMRTLATWLSQHVQAGQLTVPEPESAAEHFFGMVKGNWQVRALLGMQVGMSDGAREQAVKSAVEAFLAAYGPQAGASEIVRNGSGQPSGS
jgi:AcrR family transcriptional regulator